MKDDETVASYNIEEKGFVVCMVNKVRHLSVSNPVSRTDVYLPSPRRSLSLQLPPPNPPPFLQLRPLSPLSARPPSLLLLPSPLPMR